MFVWGSAQGVVELGARRGRRGAPRGRSIGKGEDSCVSSSSGSSGSGRSDETDFDTSWDDPQLRGRFPSSSLLVPSHHMIVTNIGFELNDV